MPKLNQVIAIEKGVKTRAKSELTRLYKVAQKSDLFNGFAKSWRKSNEEGEERPNEIKHVQARVDEVLDAASESLSELFDVTAQKDFANTAAKADVVVDGAVLLEKVPATYLLFLEKQLIDIRTFVESLPTLSTDEEWNHDDAASLFKTAAVTTRSTAKVQEPIVMYDATPEHPAQTQLITRDVTVGHWDTVKQSGAILSSRKKTFLRRIETLLKAAKFAREEANSTNAPKATVGKRVFDYLFGS